MKNSIYGDFKMLKITCLFKSSFMGYFESIKQLVSIEVYNLFFK